MSDAPSYTCPRCGMTSYNPNDVKQRYCGNCAEFETPHEEIDARLRKLLGEND